MHGWQANLKRTCALPVTFRVLPENEIPPGFTGGFLFYIKKKKEIETEEKRAKCKVIFTLKGVLRKTNKEQIENFGKNSVLILNVCSLEFLL